MRIVCKVSCTEGQDKLADISYEGDVAVSKEFADSVILLMGELSVWRELTIVTIVGDGQLMGESGKTTGPSTLRIRLSTEFERVQRRIEEGYADTHALLQSKACLRRQDAVSFLSNLTLDEVKVVKDALESGRVYFTQALEEYRASKQITTSV